MKSLLCGICAAALLCAASAASAQTVLKRHGASGRYAPISPERAAAVDANEAAFRLRRTQRARELGAQPLPGERSPGADGTLHLRYWQRQEKLRKAVEEAQRRSNEAQRRLS